MPFLFDHQEPLRRRSLPAILMRSGTSKGLFIHRDNLPANQAEWSPILLSAMGSSSGDKRQLNGVGGATSTTSKVAVVSKSKRPDADVDYTFAQVGVGSKKVDMTGNCGNIASGVGPFALDEGLVAAKPGQKEINVRVFNTNTKRIMVETIQVDPRGKFLEEGDHRISGFDGTGSRIKINFRDPAGSVTGKLLPTGNRQDEITVQAPGVSGEVTVRATIIDAANPFVFVDSATMPEIYHQLGPEDPVSLELVEQIRQKGAVLCGLAPDHETAARTRSTPKIAILSRPRKGILFAGDRISDDEQERQADIHVTGYSMGKMHPSLQLTGAVCLGAATSIPGTVAFDLRQHMRRLRSVESFTAQMPALMEEVCISQRSGKMVADVQIRYPELKVEGVSVTRTAERLFQGNVMLRN